MWTSSSPYFALSRNLRTQFVGPTTAKNIGPNLSFRRRHTDLNKNLLDWPSTRKELLIFCCTEDIMPNLEMPNFLKAYVAI